MNNTMFAVAVAVLAGCVEQHEGAVQPMGGKADDAQELAGLPAELPAWGGTDATRWTAEAVLANAVTPELQRDPAVRVSVPVALWKSTWAPFGDGQTNAAASFASWSTQRPPVIGVRGGGRLRIVLDRALPISDDTVELWTASGSWVQSAQGVRAADGALVVELEEVPAVLRDRLAVSPRGWSDVFPLAFDLPVSSATSLPAAHQTLPTGEPVLDPVGAAEAAGDGASVFEVLRTTTFPQGFNQQPYASDDLHAAFPAGSTPRITAVGGSWTWLTTTPFKNIYVCLARRNLAAEADYGVPSGAGWHHIGDPSESLINSLEQSPLLIGYAGAELSSPPANAGFA